MLTCSFLSWDKILKLAHFENYNYMAHKNLVKYTANKRNMLASLYLQQMALNIHKFYLKGP